MLPFHTPTVVKVFSIVGLSIFPLMCLQKNAKSLTPLLRWDAKFGRDTDRCSEKESQFHTPAIVPRNNKIIYQQ